MENNNIIEDESLGDAAKKFADNQANHLLQANDKTSFKVGAAWQKEKDKCSTRK
ncbi:MAG TPA: hypothetical protein VN703_02870 [Candidatus Sulfopaludibacter sp.]|nr:hypothetical protein [Candidatus Sulfopaludibacter sp.]